MNKKNLNGKALLIIIISVLFYVSIMLFSDIQEIISSLNKIKLEFYFLIFPLVVFSHVIHSLRYNQILKKIGIKISFRDSFVIYTVGTSMAITPGGIGAVIRSNLLKTKTGRSFSSTAPIIIYEKWIELLGIILLIGVFLLWTDFIESKIALVIGTIFLFLFFISLKHKIGYKIFKIFFNKWSFLKNSSFNLDSAQNSINQIFSKRVILETLPLTLFHKLISIFVVFLVFKSFGFDFDFFLSGQIYYTSTLIGILSFVPGGAIITEAGLLGLILKNGISFSLASAVVIIIRFVTLWFYTIIGFIMLKISFQDLGVNNHSTIK